MIESHTKFIEALPFGEWVTMGQLLDIEGKNGTPEKLRGGKLAMMLRHRYVIRQKMRVYGQPRQYCYMKVKEYDRQSPPPDAKPEPIDPPRYRTCLGCQTSFLSLHKFNRICKTCMSTGNYCI